MLVTKNSEHYPLPLDLFLYLQATKPPARLRTATTISTAITTTADTQTVPHAEEDTEL